MQAMGPMGMAASAITGTIDMIGGALGAKIDAIDADAASAAGISGANTANQLIGGIPLIGTVGGIFAGKTIKGNKSAETAEIADAFSGSNALIDKSVSMGGKKMLFGKRKANRFIRQQNAKNKTITGIGIENNLSQLNSIGDSIMSQNDNLYNGYSPQLLMAKKGMKFEELDFARKFLKNSREGRIESFKNGGKLDNIIVEGSLHARRHDLENINPELKGSITHKGIPVVSHEEGGEIIQHAEIEVGELILNKELSTKIEGLYNKYQESNSDEVAIEAGKLLCVELVKNTEDKTLNFKN